MNKTVLNVLLILVFIVVSGVFVAAEMSLISLRDSQIRNLSSRSSRGRKVASLTSNPNRFLSAVQIGVTLTGFLSAAFGEATLSDELGGVLAKTGMHRGVADILALVVITILISYFAIVVGELTAKRLALQRSVGFALALAPLVDA
ncbi:MAG: CNNM domain-containing protein, partial [Propionibacteriaceae bacterium]